MLSEPTIDTMNHFGEKLAQALADTQMTQYRLHKISGVPESSISKIISGDKRPTDDIIKRFANVPGLNLHEELMLEWRLMDDYPDHARMIIRAINIRDGEALQHEIFKRTEPSPPDFEDFKKYLWGDD